MSKDWRDDLSMRLEDFVDTFVVKGAKAPDVFDAIQNALDALRAAYDRDPDTPEDQSDDVIEEPLNDWPASQLSECLALVLQDSLDASEANVAGGRVFWFRMAGGGTVAPAVVRRAKMRSAFQHPPWNSYFRLAEIEACLSIAASGIPRNAA